VRCYVRIVNVTVVVGGVGVPYGVATHVSAHSSQVTVSTVEGAVQTDRIVAARRQQTPDRQWILPSTHHPSLLMG
jgi:hypothetical protein